MRYVISLIAAACIVFSASAAAAEAAAPSSIAKPFGVWQGRIGKYPVVFWLAEDACNYTTDYYYLSHLVTITLDPENPAGQAWREQYSKGAHWKLNTVTDDTLSGTWTSADGKRTLPISLKRIAVSTSTSDARIKCQAELNAFNKPRIDKIMKGAVTKDAQVGTLRYRTISVLNGNISSFEIPPGPYHASILNKGMREAMQREMVSAMECPSFADGRKTTYRTTIMPTRLLNGHILQTLVENTSDCDGNGKGNDNKTSDYYAWDISTDTAVLPGAWVSVDHSAYNMVSLPDNLKTLLQKLAGPGKGVCKDRLTSGDTEYGVSLSDTGLVFHSVPPADQHACRQDVAVPFGPLMPYLSPEGKRVAEELMKGGPGR